MQTTEDKLQALEKRIEELERDVLALKSHGVPIDNGKTQEKIVLKPVDTSNKGALKQMLESTQTPKTNKLKEAFLGKYLVGALAALLIFTGTASFIGLIWRFLSPEIKLSLMTLISLVISAVGFWLIQKKKTPIAAVTLGIGAGLTYITIISANLAFHKIGNETTLLLAGAWSVVFMLSSRYSNLFFTLIIAQIGSFITLVLGLGYLEKNMDFTLLTVFNLLIASVMYWVSKHKSKAQRVEVLIFIIANFSILHIGWFAQLFSETIILTDGWMPLVINIGLFICLNGLYDMSKDAKAAAMTLLPTFWIMVMTALNLICLNEAFFNWDAYVGLSLFFATLFIQMAYSQWRHKPLESKLTVFYVVALALTGVFLGYEIYEAPAGLVAIGVLLLALERLLDAKHQGNLMTVLLSFDALLLATSTSGKWIFIGIGLIQIGLMVYLLWYNQQFSALKTNRLMKGLSLVFLVLNSFALTRHSMMWVNPDIQPYVYLDMSYIVMLIITALLWHFRFFSEAEMAEKSHKMGFMLTTAYVFTTALYFFGIVLLNITDGLVFKLALTLCITALALAQSWLYIQGSKRQNGVVGFWLVFKYLLLTWAVIRSFAELDAASAIYSVTGLVVAIISISAGFKLNIKSIRLYGLVLTVIMVAKFILVDLSQENSIVRVLALVLGGSLCFLISYIYNRLSESEEKPE